MISIADQMLSPDMHDAWNDLSAVSFFLKAAYYDGML
jgi:hypothetical protein